MFYIETSLTWQYKSLILGEM